MCGKVNSGKKTDKKPVKSKQTSASSGVNPVKGKCGKSGLKIIHHGLKRPAPQTKGRHCKCDMCGETFGTSTSFIEHYSTTHPPLPCKDCSKVFKNPEAQVPPCRKKISLWYVWAVISIWLSTQRPPQESLQNKATHLQLSQLWQRGDSLIWHEKAWKNTY